MSFGLLNIDSLWL